MKRVLLFILMLLAQLANAQITISGQVIDTENKPLEAATIYIAKAKDNVVLEYSITNAKGNFEFKVKLPVDEKVVFKATMIGFKSFSKEIVDFKENTLNLGLIKLEDESVSLDELVIKADVPPIRVKKDTLEFNASSFTVRPDANLEELLKQLPGVQIDESKNITVNGKAVGEILVNGKPFFGEDGKIALENLPAEIINKVQVTDKKSKQEKFTGERAKSDQASLNITVDDANDKGYFGKVSGGYGSDDRYESSLFLNGFSKKTKASVIGSANNINAIGFSMDDVFDNMRTGMSGGGITTSRLLGANFVQEVNSKLNVNGSYNYNFSDTERENRFNSTNILPTGEFYDSGNSQSNTESESHLANISIDYIGEKDSFYIMPNFNESRVSNSNRSATEARNSAGDLLNDSESKVNSIGNSNTFNNTMRYMRKFSRPKQFLAIELSNNNSINDTYTHQESITNFYQSADGSDVRKQLQSSYNTNDNYGIKIEYNQPVTDSLAILIGTDWNRVQTIADNNVFDFDELIQEYSNINELQTNRYVTTETTISPFFGYSFVHKKFSSNLRTSTDIFRNDASALYNGNVYSTTKKYFNPNVSYRMDYRFSKSKVLLMSYNYNVSYQSATQLLDIVDVSDPLNTYVGNPDLKPTGSNIININYRSYNFQSRSGFSLGGNVNWVNNSIVNFIQYDEDRKAKSTFVNISGNYSWSANGNWFRSYQLKDLTIRYGVNARFSQLLTKGFIDGIMYEATSNNFSPRVYANFDYGELFRIRPSYNYNKNWTSYDNFSVNAASYYTHNASLEAILYWPKNVIFGSDFNYNYNSQIAPGYKKDAYMLNLSLAHEFYDKRFRAKLKIYDVLNQNTSSRRTINAGQILDSENLILKQYFMLSLTYSLKEFGGKNKDRQQQSRGDRPRYPGGMMRTGTRM